MKIVGELFRVMSHFALMMATMVIGLIVGIFGGSVNALTAYVGNRQRRSRKKRGEKPDHLHRPGRDDTL